MAAHFLSPLEARTFSALNLGSLRNPAISSAPFHPVFRTSRLPRHQSRNLKLSWLFHELPPQFQCHSQLARLIVLGRFGSPPGFFQATSRREPGYASALHGHLQLPVV